MIDQAPRTRPNPYILTHSRRQELTICPYREFLKYTLGLQPWVPADPLIFGTLWHELMAATYRLHAWWETDPFGVGEPELTPEEARDTILGALVHDPQPTWRGESCYVPGWQLTVGQERRAFIPAGGVIKDWRWRMLQQTRPYEGEEVPAHDPEKIDAMVAMATAMLDGYLRRWWQVDRERYRVLAVEHRMSAPILCPSGHVSWQWVYAGEVDLVLQDRDSRAVIAIDHKTSGGRPDDEIAAQRVSPQVEGYSWLWTIEHPDLPAQAIVYRTTRKKVPSIPKRNKCDGKLADGVAIDHSRCGLCGGTGLGEAGKSGKPLQCKGKRSDGVIETHAGCAKCHGSEFGPLSESACDTTPDAYAEAMDSAAADGFPPTEKNLVNLENLKAAWPGDWFGEHTRWIRSHDGGDPFARFTQETWRLTRAKMEMLRGGERGHWRADSSHVCTMFGRPCTHMALCEQNADDTLALWRGSLTYQEVFELRELTK